jgi:hypothetical protein
MAQRGFRKDAIYLVRPDGHVGLAEPNGDASALERYCDERRIRAGGAGV